MPNAWLAQEGGADAVAALLRHYDPNKQDWNLERTGPFWEAVRAAHSRGRRGAGQTIAVIDDAFDASLSALADQEFAWDNPDDASSRHGTAVALLIRSVAPEARLQLFPTGFDEEKIYRALQVAAGSPATIINMSVGKAFPIDDLYMGESFLQEEAARHGWPHLTDEDLPFWLFSRLGQLDGWRQLIRPPEMPIGRAAREVAETGRTVVAAVGNSRRHLFSPALEPGVFAVAFFSEGRDIATAMEVAVAGAPSFSQSDFSDISLIQPSNVLGSSFATPLIAGFAALMRSRQELQHYCRLSWYAGMADRLLPLRTDDPPTWSDRRDGVIDTLYRKALRFAPHSHLAKDEFETTVCPDCALFARSAYVNYGLFKLNWGDLDGSEQLLAPAERFAPDDPHAAANLGIVHALRADEARVTGNWPLVVQHLNRAAALLQKASDLRPDHAPYQKRVAEFIAGARSPQTWTLAP